MANPFPPDLWGYVHGFGHQPKGSIVPLVQTIEEATLPAIIFIRDVFHLSLQEQDHQEGAGVRERYETYKNAAIYKNETQLEFEFDLRCLPIVRPSQARPFQASPCEHHLLRPPSHDCLWRVRTGGYQLWTIQPTWVKGCQLSTIQPTWVKDCQLSTIRST